MKKVSIKISSQLSEIQAAEILNRYLTEKPSLIHIFSRKPILSGIVTTDTLKLTTFDSPPMEIDGEFLSIKDNGIQLSLTIKVDSMSSSLLGFVLGLGYPLIFGLFVISIVKNPWSFWPYFWTVLSIPMLYFAAKIILYVNYPEPDPNNVIRKISELISGKIINED